MKSSRFWFSFSLIVVFIALISLGFNIKLYSQLTADHQGVIKDKKHNNITLIDKTNLSIKFSQPMVAASRVGQQVAAKLINITPAPNGFCYWAASNRAIYTVKTGSEFKPATHYTVHLGKELKDINGNVLQGKHELGFDGADFCYKWLNAVYDKNNKLVTVELGFNAPCRASDLKQYIEISPELQYEVISSGLAKTHKIVINNVKNGQKIKLSIKAGLPAANSEFTTQKNRYGYFTIDDGTVNIANLESEYKAWSYQLKLRLNHAVAPATLLKYLKITPKVDFKLNQITPNSYNIKADFKSETYYTVTLGKGLSGIAAPALGKAEFKSVLIPKISPQVKFVDKHNIFLKSTGDMLLPVSTVGVKKIKVKLFRIYNSNLAWFLTNTSQRWYDAEHPDQLYGDELFNTTLSVNKSLDVNKPIVSYLNLGKLLKKPQPGVYELFLSLPNSWQSSRQLVIITNLAVTCKVSTSQVMAYVTDLTTGQSVAGAEVKLLSNKNQPIIAGKTDHNGCLLLKLPKLAVDTVAQLLEVQQGKDFTVLNLKSPKLKLSTDEFKLHGVNYGERKLNGFIYAPRNIYRPGEKVTLATIVRTLPELQCPKLFPVEFKIKRPDGLLFKKITTMLKTNGFAEVTVPLPASVRSGWYRVILTIPGSNKTIGKFKFLVDDFNPDKLAVTVKSPIAFAKPNETIAVKVKAEYLFGAPVSEGKATLRAYCQKLPVNNLKYQSFRFSTYAGEHKQASASVKLGKYNLDKNGVKVLKTKALERDMPLNYRMIYAVNVRSDAGDSSNGYYSVPIIKYQRLVGIRALTAIPSINRPAWLLYGLIDGVKYQKVKPRPGNQLQLTITHTVYHWEKVIENSYVSDKLTPISRVIEEKLIPANNALGKFSFVPRQEGEYTVKLTDPTSQHSSEIKLYCYGNYADYLYYSALGEGESSKTATNLSRISLNCKVLPKVVPRLDKSGKRKKSSVQHLLISLKTPIKGAGFITIENGSKILEVIPFRASATINKLSVPIKSSYPNSFKIFAAIINKSREGAVIKSDFAYGYKQLDLTTKSFALKFTGAIPNQVKPGSQLNLQLQLTNNERPVAGASVTFALVDEGICRLTGFKTPAPLPWFYRPAALTIESLSSYCALIKDKKLKSLTRSEIFYGGGALFVKSLYTKRPKDRQTVALWKSPVVTDKNGRCRVNFSIPQFIGKLRLMAVAFKNDKFGSMQHFITIKNRCVTMTKFPLFVAPKDQVKVPIVLQNSDKTQPYQGTLSINNVGNSGGGNKLQTNIKLAADAFQTVIYPLNAPLKPMPLSYTVKNSANNGEVMFNQCIKVKVRSANPPAMQVNSGRFDVTNSKIDIKLPGTWSNGEALFTLTTSPQLKLAGCLKYLLKYPYGCLEQTISGAFSLLYVPELYNGTVPLKGGKVIYQKTIQTAIDRVLSMQHYSGAFSMWPGETDSWHWGTLYAYDFLTTVKLYGYKVSPSRVERTEQYIVKHLLKSDADCAAYALYLLSSRKQHISQSEVMASYQRIIKNYKLIKLSKSVHAYLALAMGRGGFNTLAAELVKETKTTAIRSNYYHYWNNFYTESNMASVINDRAVTLMMLLAIDPDAMQIPELVKQLTAYCQQRHYSTHDAAMAIISLAKYQDTLRRQPTNCQVTIMRNNQKIGEFKVNNNQSKYFSIRTKDLQNGDITLKATGKGKIYYRYTVIGTPSNSPAPYDKVITVRRRILNDDGSLAQLDKLKLGQLYIVEVSLTTAKAVNSIVVNDMLPACFQIENGQLLTRDNSTIRNFKNSLFPSRTEPRFDRYLIFCSLPASKQTLHFYYPVRVGYRGTFTLPGIAADSMYDTSVSSRQAGQIIKVE